MNFNKKMHNNLKIFYISNMYPSEKYPYFGIFVKKIEENLINQNLKINCKSYLTKKNSKFNLLLGYIVFCINTFIKGIFCNFDIIYSHFVSRTFLIAYFIKVLKKKKLVLNFHGSDIVNNIFIDKLIKFVLKKTDLIIVPSVYFKYKVSEKYNIIKDKIFVSPSGGISENFKPYNLESLNKNNEIVLGFIGNIIEEKGWRLFVKAIEILNNKNIIVKGIIIGDGKEKEHLLNYINKNRLSNNIKYLGTIEHNDLPEYYNKFDLFIFPTKRESLGLVGIEALACGIPVIGSNIPAIKTYIKEGINGYLFNKDDVNDLVEKIIKYINLNNKMKLEMKKNAHNSVKDFYRSNVAFRMKEKFIEIMEKK